MKDKEVFRKLTNLETNTEESNSHETVAYVDDLTQVVGNKNRMILQEFIQEVYDTTVCYFETNLLSINSSKTELLSVPYGNEENPNVFVMTQEGNIIKSSKQVKILGIRFNESNNMNAHVSSILSSIGLAFNWLKPYLQHALMQQRRIIIQSKLESKALYKAPILFNESENIKKRFEGIILRLNKGIYGGNTYQKRYKDICKEIKVEPPNQKI